MDVESAHVFGDTPFERTVATLVGFAALLAACLATLQQDSGTREERAHVLGTRLAVDIFEGTAAGGSFFSFQLGSTREVASLMVEAASKGTAGFEDQTLAEVYLGVANAYLESERRLMRVAREMGAVPSAESGVRPHTVQAMIRGPEELTRVVEEQNRQVDLADRYGTRSSRAVLALAVLAVAAVLLGLAGVMGVGKTGWIAAGAAIFLLTASAAIGVTALLT